MKIAIITDVHSNIHSLNAVLNDIESENPDFIIGGGDMVGCSAFSGTKQVWDVLASKNIPLVLGNEEERIVRFHSPNPDAQFKRSIRFMPLQYRARQFSTIDIMKMSTLPVSITLAGPWGKDVLVCHASPNNINKSPMQAIDPQMAIDLQAAKAKVIVVGHLHSKWHLYWQDKLLIMAGSAGLPLRGKPDEVDYLILTSHHGNWQFRYKPVLYSYQTAIKEVIESDFVQQSGPIGWLMLDEALTQQDRITPFLQGYCSQKEPNNLDGWKRLVIDFLKHIQRWDALRPYIQPFL
jgi:predicted phosphodiesterase